MRRPLASTTVTVTRTVSIRARNTWVCASNVTTKHTKITKDTKYQNPWPSWFMTGLGPGFDSRVIVLQRADRQRLRSQRLDRTHRCRGAGQRRNARHLGHRRRAAHGAVVEKRIAAQWRVDDEIDLLVDDVVG